MPIVRAGRRPSQTAKFEVPLPPLEGKGLESWHIALKTLIPRHHPQKLMGVVSIRVLAGFVEPEGALDLVGYVQPEIAKLIESCGMIDASNAIVDSLSRWDRTIPEGMVRVEVRQTKHPRQRISAETRKRVGETNRLRRYAPVELRDL